MNQQDFIKDFVLEFPRQYIRLISFSHSFSTELFLEYGHLLAWDKHGVLGNSRIYWSNELKLKFSTRLIEKQINPLSYFKHSEKDNIKIILRKNKRIFGEFDLENLTIDFIRQNKNEIYNWGIISEFYKEIDYKFAKEFYIYLKPEFMFANPYVDWTDFNLVKLFILNYHIIKCKFFWDTFISSFINDESIKLHIKSMDKLNKTAKINWKTKLSDGTFKYLFGIYINSNFCDQMICSLYHYDKSDYETNTWYDVTNDMRIVFEK